MSEPDAVPLPRDGAVFFDVRGEARSMRLSWYADSAVAVFSIWQGNRCTGTFRLPFADLVRMVETLQSGPPAHPASAASRQPGAAAIAGPADAYPVTASHEAPYSARGRGPAASARPGQGRHDGSRPSAETATRGGRGRASGAPAQYPPGYGDVTAYLPAERAEHAADPGGYAGHDHAEHGQFGQPYPDRRPANADYGDYPPAPGHRTAQHVGPGPPGPTAYQSAPGYPDAARHAGRAEYGAAEPQAQPPYRDSAGHPDPARYADAVGYAGPSGHAGAGGPANTAGYSDPGDYANSGAYTNSGGYADPHGYAAPADPGGHPDPGSYRDPARYTDPGGLRDRGYPAPPEPWLPAPTGQPQRGRHGADQQADIDAPGSHPAPPPGEQLDSDWQAATAAYRAL